MHITFSILILILLLRNRILYFYFENNSFILLHMFKKKTNKTPKSEINKAINESNDYKKRNRGKLYENLGRFQEKCKRD